LRWPCTGVAWLGCSILSDVNDERGVRTIVGAIAEEKLSLRFISGGERREDTARRLVCLGVDVVSMFDGIGVGAKVVVKVGREGGGIDL